MSVAALLALLGQANARGWSDLYLGAGRAPVARLDGAITHLPEPVTDGVSLAGLIEQLASADQQAQLAATGDADFAVALANGQRLRGHALRTDQGLALVLRPIRSTPPDLATLNAPPALATLINRHRGLVLVTGPTGSGKSTTLAAMIREIDRTRPCHILTIEDPIEFVHTGANGLISQREIGRDADSFATALRGALRSAPDVLLIGEMRDLETIRLALTAAETGHLVFGTLHTTSAAKTIDRVVDVFPAGEKDLVRTQLASVLAGIVAQALLPSIGGGRVGAFELLLATPAIRSLIRENQLHQIPSMLQLGQRAGMTMLRDEVRRLVAEGRVDGRDAAPFLAEGGEDPAPQATPASRPDPILAEPRSPPPTDRRGYSF